jgi:hypothetical protein
VGEAEPIAVRAPVVVRRRRKPLRTSNLRAWGVQADDTQVLRHLNCTVTLSARNCMLSAIFHGRLLFYVSIPYAAWSFVYHHAP